MSDRIPLLDETEPWGSDTEVSKPIVPDNDILVDFGGFGFTTNGLAHNITEEASEAIFMPRLAPPVRRSR